MIFLLVSSSLLTACTGSSSGSDIDQTLGLAKGDGPVLTSMPGFSIHQMELLSVDINNVKDGLPGNDTDMAYACVWDQTVDGSVTSTQDCSTLPGVTASFNAGSGKLEWKPSLNELGDYEIKVKGTNKAGSDQRVFAVSVRLQFSGLESISNLQGDRMDLNWTANPAATGYQIMLKNPDNTFSVFQTITSGATSTVSLTGLTPLQTYTWRVNAVDNLGNIDGNQVSLSATTSDLIRLEITSADSQLSPGQSTLVTMRLKDNAGNYLPSSGLSVTFLNDGSGTGAGVFSATNDLGNGIYTATFTATTPGTLTRLSASIPQYHYVQVKANMTVSPLKIEILSSGTTVNPGGTVSLTAKIRDFAGNLMSTSGHSLSFNYSGGTSTGTFSAVTDNGNGTYTATFTGSTAGTAVTFGASISTTSQIYSTSTVTVQPWNLEITSALTDVSVTRATTVTARVKDWQGNYLLSGGKGLTLSISGVGGIASIGSTTDVGDGTYTATFSGISLGSVSVTASASQSYTVTLSPTINVRKLRLEFLSSVSNLMPGQTATLTARVKDWQGTIVNVGGHGLSMSTSGGTSTGSIGTITDNNNGTYTSSFVAASAGTALSITGTINESFQVDQAASITVQKWRLLISSSAATVPTGQTVTLTATVQDYLGNQASSGGQSVFFSLSGGTSSGSISTVTDNGDGTYSATFMGLTPGTATTMTASLSQSYQVTSTASLTVQAIKLLVSVSQSTLNPGKTLTVSAQVQDQAGNNLTTGSYTIGFSYSGGTSTGSFSATSSLGSGLYQATFTSASAGTAITMAANASVSYTVATPQPTVTVAPWKIEIAAAATNVPVGQVTTLTGRIKDWQDNYITSGGQNLSMSLGTAGRGSLSAVTDNSDGTYTATFTASGVGTTAVTASLSESFTVAVAPTLNVTAVHLALSAVQTSLNPGRSVIIQAQVKDSLGNNLTTGSYTIGFSASGGTSTGVFGSTTSLGLGLYSTTFTGMVAGTAVTVSANANYTYSVDTTVAITVVPWKIEISTAAASVPVGQSTTLTGRIKDWQNNYVASGGQNLSMSLGTAGRGSLSAVTDNSDGTYSATFTAGGVGTTAVSGSLSDSFTVTVSPTLTVTAVHIALSAVQTSLNPGDSVTIQAQVKDSLGNNLTTGSYTIGFSSAGGTSTGVFGSTTSLGLGLYSTTFTGMVAGTAVTVSANANYTYSVDNTLSVTVVPWKIEITASKTSYVINEAGTLTARMKDWQNNFLTAGGKSLNLSLVTGGVGTIGTTVDNSDGTYTASFQANAQGSTAVSASLAQSYQVTVTPTLTVEKVYIDVTVGSPEVTSSSVNSGNLIAVTARLKNSSGNPVTGTGYVVSFSASSGTSTVAQSAVVEVSTGVYQANFQGVTAGTALTVSAATTVPYSVNSTSSLTVTPGTTISASNSTLTISAASVRAGQSVTLTAILKDAAGNVIPGLSGVAFSNAANGTSTGSFGTITDAGSGVYSADFTGGAAGTATTLRVAYGGVTVSQTVSITVTSGVPSKLTVSGPSSVYANTCTSTPFALSFFDSANNPTTLASATTFVFGGQGYARFYSDSGCTSEITQLDVASGQSVSQNFYLKSYDPAALSLTFSGAGITQNPSSHSLTVVGVMNWLGVAGVLDSIASPVVSSAYFAPGKYDGALNAPYSMAYATISGVDYLFVSDTSEHTITKVRLSDGAVIGKIGRIGGSVGSSPTSGGTSCTSLALNAGNTAAGWCPGGWYQSGAGEGAFNTPTGLVVLGGYLYVADNGNHRIVKVDADTGAWIGWSGRFTGTIAGGTCAGATAGTSPTWCLGGTGSTAAASAQIAGSPNTNAAYGSTATGATGGNEFRNPLQMASDGTNIYVNDSGNNRLVKLNPANGKLLAWMGWVYDNTGISCTSGNTPGGPTGTTANEFTDSWCTGGRSGSAALGQQLGSAGNWAKVNPGWQTLRGIAFYNDGTNSFMYTADYNTGRILRYTKAEGYYRGWTGRTYNSTGGSATPAAPAPIASLMTGTCSSTTSSYTMGWCYGGGGANVGNSNGLNAPSGIRVSGNILLIANTASANVTKLNLDTGLFGGYVGRVAATPTGGSANCSVTASGSVTPGWCIGGTTTHGVGTGHFTRIDNTANSSDSVYDVETDGTKMFTTDRNNSRIVIHTLSSGAALGSIGLRVSQLTASWSKNWTGVPTLPFAPITVVQSRDSIVNAPYGVSIAGDYMYVADTGFHRLKRYTWDTGVFEGWIGVMSAISPTGGDDSCIGATLGGMTPNWCKGGGSTSSTSTGFNNPRDMVSDGTSLYVADNSNHRIAKIRESDGLFLGWIGGISSTPADSLYDVAGCTNASNTVTPNFCLGGASTSSASVGGYSSPRALAGFVDANDGQTPNHYYLIVADSGNARIQKVDMNTGQSLGFVGRISTAGCGTVGTATAGWCTSGAVNTTDTTGLVNNNAMTTPTGVWVDTSVNPAVAYVVDGGRNRVLKFNASTGAFLGWVGRFGSNITAHGCGSTPTINTASPGWCTGGNVSSGSADGEFNSPHSITGDASYLYVTDLGNNRVVRITKSTGVFAGWKGRISAQPTSPASCVSAGAVSGTITPDWCFGGSSMPGYTFDTNTPSVAAGFDTPRGIAIRGNYLIIVDSGNNRILSMPK